jgi:hypothetical protein
MLFRWIARPFTFGLTSLLCVAAHAQAPAPSFVTEKELLITDLSVVNDARTLGPNGPWSFGGLMTRMAPTEAAAGQFVKDWLAIAR